MRYKILKSIGGNFDGCFIYLDTETLTRTRHRASMLEAIESIFTLKVNMNLYYYSLVCESDIPLTIKYIKEHYPEEFV